MPDQTTLVLRPLRVGLLHEPLRQDELEGRQAGGAADRMTAESRDVPEHRIGLQRRHDPVRSDEGSERHASSERLGRT